MGEAAGETGMPGQIRYVSLVWGTAGWLAGWVGGCDGCGWVGGSEPGRLHSKRVLQQQQQLLLLHDEQSRGAAGPGGGGDGRGARCVPIWHCQGVAPALLTAAEISTAPIVFRTAPCQNPERCYHCSVCVCVMFHVCPAQLQTPPAGVMLAPKEKAAMQAIWRSCCPVTKGLEAPDICASL